MGGLPTSRALAS